MTLPSRLLIIDWSEYRAGLMIRTEGALFKFSSFISQNDSATPCESAFSTTTTAVPVASNTAAPATTTVFALVQAISFKAHLMRVRVEPLAAAPLATAIAEIVFAKATGAAWTELAETAPAMMAVVVETPRLEKYLRIFSNARFTRIRAASSFAPSARPT